MSKTVSEPGVSRDAQPALAVRLVLGAIALGMLTRPAVLLWAEHIDTRFAEEPMGTVLQLSLALPVVLVPISVVVAMVASSWGAAEKAVLALMLPIAFIQIWIAPPSFGCSDVGGVAEPCGIDGMGTTREIAMVLISAMVVAALIWVGRPRRNARVAD